MYETDFICTYKLIKEEDVSDILYKMQYLQAFNLKSWDDKEINRRAEQVYEIIWCLPQFRDMIKLTPAYKTLPNSFEAFQTLFSYDTFDVMHRWLCDVLNNSDNVASDEIYNNLTNRIKELNDDN